jgi:lactoylglutathione lyase
MKLNHLNLTVTDVLKTHDFLQKYFDLRTMGKPNQKMAFLTDDNGLVLSMFQGIGQVKYPDTFHIGFIQDNAEKVNEINRRLKEDGFEVDPPGRMHGSWTFYFRSPGGFTIEVLS